MEVENDFKKTVIGSIPEDWEIKTASEGLKLIKRDAFANIKLSKLKALAKNKKEEYLEKEYPSKIGSRILYVEVTNGSAVISFYASKASGETGPDFKLNYNLVEKYASKLKLGKPEGIKKSTDGLTWEWVENEFKCKLQIVDVSYTSSSLNYECKYN